MVKKQTVVAGRKRIMRILYFVLFLIAAVGTRAEPDQAVSEVSKKAIAVKQSVLELNRDLYKLEEDLLSPATTRASIFMSLSHGDFFELHSIHVLVDDKQPIQYIYTERQITALRQGAIQPLKELNLGPGIHQIKAIAKGVDNNGKPREFMVEKTIEKHEQPLYIELKIKDKKDMQSAELLISQW
jgi:hypothetical protein